MQYSKNAPGPHWGLSSPRPPLPPLSCNPGYGPAHRIVDTWNSLDDNIIACDSINGFKCKIDRFLYGRGFI